MADTAQNDWDVVRSALDQHAPLPIAGDAEALVALERLREFTEVTIAGLNERVAELEKALSGEKEGWPVPAELPPDYWESAQ